MTRGYRHDPFWGLLCHFLLVFWHRGESKHHGCCYSCSCPSALVICQGVGKKRRKNAIPPDPCGLATEARRAAPHPGPGRVPPRRPALPFLSPRPRCQPPRSQRARRRKAVFSKPDYVILLPSANPACTTRGKILRKTHGLFLPYASLNYATGVRRVLT